MVHSVKDALEVTAKKEGYTKKDIPELLFRVRNGEFNILAEDYNARGYVKSLSEEQLQMQIEHIDDKNLNLTDIVRIIGILMQKTDVDKNSEDFKAFLCDELIKIFNNQASFTLNDGRIFGERELKEAMLEKCIEMGNKRIRHQGRLYEDNLNVKMDSFDQVAYLSGINDPNSIYLAINTNPTFAGYTIGELVSSGLETLIYQNQQIEYQKGYDLVAQKVELNSIIDNLKINNAQKLALLFGKITNDEVKSIEGVDINLINKLKDIPANKLKIVVLINALSLAGYSASNSQAFYTETPTLESDEYTLYTYDYDDSENVIHNYKNSEYNIDTEIEIFKRRERLIGTLGTFKMISKNSGVAGIAEYINSLNLTDLKFLCELYLKTNSNKAKQELMRGLDYEEVRFGDKQLMESMYSRELFDKLQTVNIDKINITK